MPNFFLKCPVRAPGARQEREKRRRGLSKRTPRRPSSLRGGSGRHHGSVWTMPLSVLLAGGGVKHGITYGETDELGFSIARDKVHVHDLQATILHLLGFDHEKLTYRFQGRDFRLTDVQGKSVKDILA